MSNNHQVTSAYVVFSLTTKPSSAFLIKRATSLLLPCLPHAYVCTAHFSRNTTATQHQEIASKLTFAHHHNNSQGVKHRVTNINPNPNPILSTECHTLFVSQLALDLVVSPASQAYVERLFSLCGDLTARKRNSNKVSLCRRVFLKLNLHILH